MDRFQQEVENGGEDSSERWPDPWSQLGRYGGLTINPICPFPADNAGRAECAGRAGVSMSLVALYPL